MVQHHAISLREMCRGFSTSEAIVKKQLMEMQTGWPVDKQTTSSAALSCTREHGQQSCSGALTFLDMCRDIRSKAGWIWLISNLQSFSVNRTGCNPSQTCGEEQEEEGRDWDGGSW